MRKLSLVIALVAVTCAATILVGQSATVTNGTLNLGVNTYGNVFDPVAYVGLQIVSNGDDAIAPGSPRSGWGVAAGGTSGWADPYDFGVVNLNFVGFSNTASTVTSDTQLPGLLGVHQVYSPSSNANIYQDRVTLTNISGGALSNVMFSQQTDWDMLPTRFYEYSTVNAWGKANVVYTTPYGFDSPNPLGTTCYFGGCNTNGTFGPADLGEGIVKNFGWLGAGKSVTFTMYYGGDLTTAAMWADLYAIGDNPTSSYWENFILQGTDPSSGLPCTSCDTWAFAIHETPEPGTLVMFGTGLLGFVGLVRRKINL